MNNLKEIISNQIIISLIATIIITTITKYFFDYKKKKKSLIEEALRTGGMPSGHSAITTALTTSILLTEGITTSFIISLVLTIIVIRDSFGVRWSVGEQAIILKKILKHDHIKEKIKVVEGHTIKEVIAGTTIGIITSIIINAII